MNKKGFTLVELLATIVILAVISIITVPMVVGVVENSRKSAFQISCDEIYRSYKQYELKEEIVIGEDDCIVFDFGSNIEEAETINGIRYEPIEKLNLKGDIPNAGTYKICNGTRQLLIENGNYTCIRDENRNEVLEGGIGDNDVTAPLLKDISLSSTTNSIIVVVDAEEDSGLIKKYYYRINGEEITKEITSESNVQLFEGLEIDTEYSIEVQVENQSGLISNKIVKTIRTQGIQSPIIAPLSQSPTGTTYAQAKVIGITYTNTNIDNPEYYFKSSVEATVEEGVVTAICGNETNPKNCIDSSATTLALGTWYKTTSANPSITYTSNGTLYALTSAGDNISGTSTYEVTMIDTSEPSASLSVGLIKTDRVTVTAICKDDESGITKYEYSKDDGSTWVDNGKSNTYTFTGLTKETEYIYQVRCTNGSGMPKTASNTGSPLEITNPIIDQISQNPEETTYAQSKVIGITYINENIENPEYYFKSSVEATVEDGTVIGICGTETNPGECTSTSVTTLVANTWYKTTSTTPSITYTINGTLYALTSDGTNVSGTSTFDVTKIDASEPSAGVTVAAIKTDRATLTATCSDNESDITKYEYSSDNGKTWIDNGTINTYIFTGLNKETEYTYKVRCTNGSGLTKIASSTESTLGMINPIIDQISQTPDKTPYAQSKVIGITYINENIENPEYYFKSSVEATVEDGTVIGVCGNDTNPGECTETSTTTLSINMWYKTISVTPSITYKQDGTLYALTSDGKNISGTSTYDVTKIDTSEPDASISVGAIKTDRATLTATCSDTISGITKYEFSSDNGTTWADNGTVNTYTFTGLNKESEYKYQVRCTNGAGLTKTASSTESTLGMTNPLIGLISQVPDDTEYAESKVIGITYSNTNITSPEYYFKSSVSVTVPSGTVTASCGNETTPGQCSSSSVTALTANIWYKTASITPSITYTSNGTLYALVSDGTNVSGTSTYDVTKIDTSEPSVSLEVDTESIKTDRVTLIATCSDTDSGITKYEFSNGSEWVDNGTTNTYTFTELTAETEYTYQVRCTNGSGLKQTVSTEGSTAGLTNPQIELVNSSIVNGYTWAQNRTLRVTYTNTNIENPEYYFKSSVSATVPISGGIVIAECGTGTKPGTCTNSSVTTLVADTWYKTESTNPSITYKQNGTLYALISDGANISGTSSYDVTKTSNGIPTTPTITGGSTSWTTTDRTIWVSTASTEASGIKNYQYYISTSPTAPTGGSWSDLSSGSTGKSIATNGTRYIFFRAVANNGLSSAASNYQVTKVDTSVPSASLELDTESLKTDRATLIATCSDTHSGISKYEFSKDDGTTWVDNGTTNTYTFTGLTAETKYTYQVRCTNGANLVKTASTADSTLGLTNPTIIRTSRNQINGYDYAIYEGVKLSYTSENIANPVYYFKSSVEIGVSSGIVIASCGTGTTPGECTSSSATTLVAGTWYKTENTTINITYTNSGTLYALVSDGTNISGTSTYDVTKVDASSPSVVSLSAGTLKTDRITLTATCTDNESGITKYEFSKDNGTTWVNNGTTRTYTFTGLTQDTEYTFKVRCTNGASGTGTATSTSSTTKVSAPSFSNTSSASVSGYTWAISRAIQITYYNSNIENPVYYFKSSVSATVPSGTVTASCGTGTVPGTCTSSSVTTLVAGTWYRTTSTTPNITYTQNGTLYAITSDGTNISGTSSYDITKTSDGTPTTPTITGGSTSWTSSSRTIKVSTASTETSGIANYQYYVSTNSSTPTGGSWNNLSSGVTSKAITTNGTRYIFFRAVANNGKKSPISNYQVTKIDSGTPTAPTLTVSNSDWSTTPVTVSISTASTATSGIQRYQYCKSTTSSSSGCSWIGLASGATSVIIDTEGINYIFFRAVSNSNKIGTVSSSALTQIDMTAPGATTVTYNSGSNTNTWKNNYNITLSASDNIGISHYEIDIDKNGTVEHTTESNFIPWNNYASEMNRFRAVDNAGNVGPWTGEHAILMDTVAPTIHYFTWGSVTSSSAQFHIQVYDASNESGIPSSSQTYDGHMAGVYCYVSTQSGGYTNWKWFTTTYNTGSSAYLCNITPSTFGHYGQTYKVRIYAYDRAGNRSISADQTVTIPAA